VPPRRSWSWVRQAERTQGRRPDLTTEERQRLKQLERENVELRRANEILKKAAAYFAQAELDSEDTVRRILEETPESRVPMLTVWVVA
jgi:transposase